MINIKELFENQSKQILNNHKLIDINTKIKIYYGISNEGLKRISFLSSCKPYTIESTKLIKISQFFENNNVYWTCFDLVDNNAEKVFYSFCNDLIECLDNCDSESECLTSIKDRFGNWRKLFSRENNNLMSDETAQGLFGELYFLYHRMIAKYEIDHAIKSWGGPNGDSKDFTINSTWYEVKTVSTEAVLVKISSLTQLDSDVTGYLSLVRVEKMSNEFEYTSIDDLVSLILEKIEDSKIKSLFLKKLEKLKYSPSDMAVKTKYNVHDISLYKVDNNFPRIKSSDIKSMVIDKVTYCIYIKGLEQFREEI